jgi:hypothetical protein
MQPNFLPLRDRNERKSSQYLWESSEESLDESRPRRSRPRLLPHCNQNTGCNRRKFSSCVRWDPNERGLSQYLWEKILEAKLDEKPPEVAPVFLFFLDSVMAHNSNPISRHLLMFRNSAVRGVPMYVVNLSAAVSGLQHVYKIPSSSQLKSWLCCGYLVYDVVSTVSLYHIVQLLILIGRSNR